MIASILCVYRLILPEFRTRFFYLILASTVVALLDMVGVASIAPLVAVMVDPAALAKSGSMRTLLTALGYGARVPPVHMLGFMTIGFFVIGNVAALVLSWWSIRYSASLSVALSRQLAKAHFRQPFQFFMTNPPPVLANQLCNEVSSFAVNGILQLCGVVVRIIQIVLIGGFLTWLAPAFTFGSLVILGGLYALVYRFSASRLSGAGRSAADNAGEALHLATEMYGNSRDILLRGESGLFAAQVCDKLELMFQADRIGRMLPSLPKYALEVIAVCLIFSLPIYRSLMGQDASAEMPMIAAFAYAGFRLLPTMQQLYSSLAILKTYHPSASRLFAMLSTSVTEGPGTRLERMPPVLAFKDVAHTYRNAERPAVSRADFILRRGERAALVGPSGAGKSTVIDMLLGLLPPTQGTILADGTAPSAGRLSWASGTVGYVPQSPLILNSTIAANIAFGVAQADINYQRCREAAVKAGIDHLAGNHPKGLDAVVGRDIENFSGGERQRLAVARAFYTKPSLLVLDEPASALDPPSAAKLFGTLCAKDLDATVVVVTHDLDYLVAFDKVIFMENGAVVMAAPLAELMAKCPAFVRFRGLPPPRNEPDGGQLKE